MAGMDSGSLYPRASLRLGHISLLLTLQIEEITLDCKSKPTRREIILVLEIAISSEIPDRPTVSKKKREIEAPLHCLADLRPLTMRSLCMSLQSHFVVGRPALQSLFSFCSPI